MAAALPVGDWDAWALWNLRAKFFAGPPGAWRYAFSPLLTNTHNDYPPLLSAFVAQAWKAGGDMHATVPALTSLLSFAVLLALLVSAVALLRGAASGLLVGLVILSTATVLNWAPAEYADIPLAFYNLGALALIFMDAAQAPSSDAVVTPGLAKVADLSRYAAIASGFFTNLLSLGSGLSHPLILLAILAILLRWHFEERYRVASRIAGTVIVAVFLSNCAVLLITPNGLDWQVQTAFDRLILQLWPCVLLIVFVFLCPVMDPAAAVSPAKRDPSRKAPMRSIARAAAANRSKTK